MNTMNLRRATACAMLALGLAGCGGESGSSPPTQPTGATAAPARIEVDSKGLILAPGATAPLSAHVFDGDGQPMPGAAVQWTSSGSAVAVDASGLVTAGATIASAQVTAHVGVLRSAPVTALVATLVAGTRVVADVDVLADPQPLDDAQGGLTGSRYRTTLAGIAPDVGQMLISGGGKAIAGRVVSTAPAAQGNDVVFESVGLADLFDQLSLHETYDGRSLATTFPTVQPDASVVNADGSTTYTFTQALPDTTVDAVASTASTRSARRHALDGAPTNRKFKLGPFSCDTDVKEKLVFSASQLVTTLNVDLRDITAQIDIDHGFGGMQVTSNGFTDLSTEGPIRIGAKLTGNVGCTNLLFERAIPVPPPVAVVMFPSINAGAKLALNGAFTINSFEIELKGHFRQPFTAGFELGPDGTFTNLSALDEDNSEFTIHGNLRSSSLDSPYRVEASAGARLYVEAALTNIPFYIYRKLNDDYPYLSMLEGTVGVEPQIRLGSIADQVNDPAFSNTYQMNFKARMALGSDATSALGWLGKLLKLGQMVAPELSYTKTLFSPPKGTGRSSLTTFAAGDKVHFLVDLTADSVDPQFLGTSLIGYNVSRVEIWRKDGNGGAGRVASADAAAGQTAFDLAWTADKTDKTKGAYVAVVVPVFGDGFEFKVSPVLGWSGITQFGTAQQIGRAVATDSAGAVYVTGYTTGGIIGLPKPGGIDAQVVRFDAKGGAALAGTVFGGAGDDVPVDMIRAADGSLFVAGYSFASDITGTGSPSAVSSWVAKVKFDDSHAPEVLARTQWGTTERERASSLALGPDGELYVVGTVGVGTGGTTLGSVQCADPTSTSFDCGDVAVTRFDPGNLGVIWHSVDKRRGWQWRPHLSVDSGGTVWVAAQSICDITWDQPSADQPDCHGAQDVVPGQGTVTHWGLGVWKFDGQSGAVRDKHFVKLDHSDIGLGGAAVDASGNLVVVGGATGAFPGQSSAGAVDAFALSFSPQWDINWTTMLGSAGDDIFNAVVPDGHGGFLVTGSTGGSLFGATNAGGSDAIVARLSATGQIAWGRQFGGPGNDAGIGLATDPYGSVFVTGQTDGRIGDGVVISTGGVDGFVAKFGAGGTAQTASLAGRRGLNGH